MENVMHYAYEYTEEYFHNYLKKLEVSYGNTSYSVYLDFNTELEENCKLKEINCDETDISGYIHDELLETFNNCTLINNVKFNNVITGIFYFKKPVFSNVDDTISYFKNLLKNDVNKFEYYQNAKQYCKDNGIDTWDLTDIEAGEIFENKFTSIAEYKIYKRHNTIKFKNDPNYVEPKSGPIFGTLIVENGKITDFRSNY